MTEDGKKLGQKALLNITLRSAKQPSPVQGLDRVVQSHRFHSKVPTNTEIHRQVATNTEIHKTVQLMDKLDKLASY